MTNLITAFILLSLQILTSVNNDIFKEISTKTWFEDNGFAGVNVIFMKSETGGIKAIRQINGSGLPVVATEIYDVKILQDTIYLINSFTGKSQESSKTNYYTYSDRQGLVCNGKPLRVIWDEPILYVCPEKGKFYNTRVNVNELTAISFEKNEFRINDAVFKIIRED